MTRRFHLSAAVLLAATLFSPLSMHAQLGGPSFGLLPNQKKSVTLKMRLPPIYSAAGKNIVINMETPRGDLANEASEVEISLEKDLTQNDSGIKLGGATPDIIIACGVSRYGRPAKQQTTENGNTVVHLAGTLSVAFRIYEPGTNRVIKSDIAVSEQSEEVSRTTPTNSFNPSKYLGGLKITTGGTKSAKMKFANEEEMRRFMIDDVSRKVASYVVNTEEPVDVPLAVGGVFEEPDKLALGGLWSRSLEALETLPPFADAKSESYRTYNIGVANEALAYQAADNKSAIKYLQEASIDYGKALEARGDERNYIDAQNRIKSALSQYADIGRFADATQSAAAPDTAAAAPGAAEGSLTNADIIAMVKNHLDEANILDTIQTSTSIAFDVSPKGQIALSQGGVNGKIILAMKTRARGAASPSTPPPPPAKSTKK
jgi:hypothetical protein